MLPKLKIYFLSILLSLLYSVSLAQIESIYGIHEINSDLDTIHYLKYKNNLFFSTGERLLKTDGLGFPVQISNALPRYLVEYNNLIFFNGFDGTNKYELWKSDGTAAGTSLVKDINNYANESSDPKNLTVFNGNLYFSADHLLTGRELYKSNGTSIGTVLLKDINTSNYPQNSSPADFTVYNNYLYFSAWDGQVGFGGEPIRSLWRTDGTAAGTIKFGNFPDPNNLIVFQGKLFLYSGGTLYSTNGMTTQNIRPIYDPKHFIVYNDNLYFWGLVDLPSRHQLWKSDGTTSGTSIVKSVSLNSLNPRRPFYIYNNFLYFQAYGSDGVELWRSDGTANGTLLLKDIFPESNSSGPKNFFEYECDLYFSAFGDINIGQEVYVIDSTSKYLEVVQDYIPGSLGLEPRDFIEFNGYLYFLGATSGNQFRSLYRYKAPTPPIPGIITSYKDTDVTGNFCEGDFITLKVKDVGERYSYLWYDVHNNFLGETQDSLITISAPTVPSGSNSYSTSYKVYSKKNSCLISVSPGVSAPVWIYPAAPSFGAFSKTEITCHNANDGVLIVLKSQITGGVKPYSILLEKDPLGLTIPTPATKGDSTFSNLKDGYYGLTIGDANQKCYSTQYFTYANPALLTASVSFEKDITCNGANDGRITITYTGGTGTKLFTINNGSSFEGINVPGPARQYTNLIPDNYQWWVKDANNCRTTTQTVAITESAALDLNFAVTNPGCGGTPNNGIINAIGAGGTSPYQYNLNASPYNTASTFNNLAANSYTIGVRDANNCLYSEAVTLSNMPPVILAITSIDSASCFGQADGRIQVTGTSGTPPYQYAIGTESFQASNLFTRAAGTHEVIVKDAAGCKDTKQVNVPQPLDINIDFIVTNVSCKGINNGSVAAEVTGGNAPYAYSWTGLTQTTSTLTNIYADSYQVKVTDRKNCSKTSTTNVTEPATTLSVSLLTFSDATCKELCDGSITLDASGGVGPYSYKWMHSNALTNATASNLCGNASYTAKVKDNNNCEASYSKYISNGTPVVLDMEREIQICPGQRLMLDAENTGASYLWTSEGGYLNTNQVAEITEEDTYYVSVKDGNGCEEKDTFNIHYSLDALKAQFLLPSMVPIGDTVMFIEISWPIPDSVKWDYGTGANLLNNSPTHSQLAYPKVEDTISIKMVAYLGECIDTIKKQIIFFNPILRQQADPNKLGVITFRELKLYPNPNDGHFKLDILLSEVTDVTLGIYTLQGVFVEEKEEKGKSVYQLEFHKPELPQGYYLLKAKIRDEVRTIGFLVFK